MPATHRPTLRRVASLAVAATALSPLAAVPPAAAVPTPEPGAAVAPADAALDWLAAELVAHGGLLTVEFDGISYPDPGLTLDAVLALAGGGRGDDPAVAAAEAALPGQMPDYLTGFSGGTARAAGAVAKTLLTEEVLGVDLSPGYDLEPDLRSLMDTSGDHAGRFRDREGWGDFSNGLGQALGLLALGRTSGGAPAAAVGYLLDQQCADGSFRLYYDPGTTCTDPAAGDPDATAMALMALLTVPNDAAVAAAVDSAADHLVARQGADGGIAGTGAVNANTTGLAGAALRAAGAAGPADSAAAFVRSLQWVESCADLGAVAYDAAARSAATSSGELVDRSQWTRATAQGALGLGLPAYGAAGIQAPVPAGLAPIACPGGAPPVTTPTTVPLLPAGPGVALTSGVSVPAGGTLAGTAHGFEPGESVLATLRSTPRVLGTVVADAQGAVAFSFRVPADIEPGRHRLVLTGQASGRTAEVEVEVTGLTVPGTLPATGATTAALAGLGAGLVLAGASLRRAAALRAEGSRSAAA